jgi:hypothetical protein
MRRRDAGIPRIHPASGVSPGGPGSGADRASPARSPPHAQCIAQGWPGERRRTPSGRLVLDRPAPAIFRPTRAGDVKPQACRQHGTSCPRPSRLSAGAGPGGSASPLAPWRGARPRP